MRGPAWTWTMDPPRPYLWYLLQVIQTHFSIFIHFGGKYYILTLQQSLASPHRGVSIQKISWVEGSRSEYKMRIEKILKTSKRNRREMTSIMLSSFFLILFLICSLLIGQSTFQESGGLWIAYN